MRYELLLIAPIAIAGCNHDHSLGANPPVYPTDAEPQRWADASPTVTMDARTLGALGPTESWTGYIENFRFSSGSDVIKFSFATDPSGEVAGSVVFGNGTPPAPATDPNVGYPPGLGIQWPPFVYGPTEGLSYTITSGTLVSNRLRFTTNNFELWDGWCRMQPAPTDGSDMCLPNWSGGSKDGVCYQTSPAGKDVVVDCGKLTLCFLNRVCACSPSGCMANPASAVSFDMFMVSGSASGSVAGALGGEHNVHFIKDP